MRPSPEGAAMYVAPKSRTEHGPLERQAPQEGDLGLARIRRHRLRRGQRCSGRSRSPTSTSSPASRTRPRSRSIERTCGPQSEVVFVQSDDLTIRDPGFQAAVEDVTGRLRGEPYVENVHVAAGWRHAVSEDGHAALVEFEIAGDSTRGQGPRGPDPRRGRSRAEGASRRRHRAVRQRQREQGDQPDDRRRPQERRAALGPGHADHPHDHLRQPRRGERAAAHRPDIRARRPGPRRAAEPDPPGGRQPPGRDPAHRPRRRAWTTRCSTCGANARSGRPVAASPRRWRPPPRRQGARCSSPARP